MARGSLLPWLIVLVVAVVISSASNDPKKKDELHKRIAEVIQASDAVKKNFKDQDSRNKLALLSKGLNDHLKGSKISPRVNIKPPGTENSSADKPGIGNSSGTEKPPTDKKESNPKDTLNPETPGTDKPRTENLDIPKTEKPNPKAPAAEKPNSESGSQGSGTPEKDKNPQERNDANPESESIETSLEKPENGGPDPSNDYDEPVSKDEKTHRKRSPDWDDYKPKGPRHCVRGPPGPPGKRGPKGPTGPKGRPGIGSAGSTGNECYCLRQNIGYQKITKLFIV